MQRRPGLSLALIVLVAIAAGFFVYPKGPWDSWRPWRLGLDLVGGSHLVYGVDLSQVGAGERESVLNGLRDVIERRVNFFGVSEPQVFTARSGEDYNLVVELAGVKDIGAAVNEIGTTPLLDFREVWGSGTSTEYVPTNLTGRYIKSAQLSFDSTTQRPEVALEFDEEGGQIFANLTERNVGKPIAVFLDNVLIEQPVVQQKITGGKAVITGQFTIQTARALVERFNAGALPAPITLVSQITVNPTLGAESLKNAIMAGGAGTAAVMVFMVLYYGTLGLFASLALIIYIVFTLAVFKIVPITLTLAGLAGLIITIGMAVDANVLIFERFKEERKKAGAKQSALQEGFSRAWPSIRDSNTSTIITAVILYYFTSSFVKGFALTLLLGTAVSLFSAITTTRLFLRVFMREKKPLVPSAKGGSASGGNPSSLPL